MTDCVFCKIINRELPADIVYEDDNTIAFMNIKPISKGHLLVVPKKHAQDLLENTDEELANLMSAVKKIAPAALKVTGSQGFNLSVNTGSAAGQIIFHTHFHIIPRYSNDGLQDWPHSDSEPKTRADIAAEIKKHIS